MSQTNPKNAANGARAAFAISEDIHSCRRYILDRLTAKMDERKDHLDWVDRERMEVAVAANEWARAHGYDRWVATYDVERIEGAAVGHVDYASKLALYVAEFVVVSSPAGSGEVV